MMRKGQNFNHPKKALKSEKIYEIIYYTIYILIIKSLMILGCSKNETSIKLSIGAAGSLTDVTKELVDNFKKEIDYNIYTQITIASSGVLASQILQGAPIDVFLSASIKQYQRVANAQSLKRSAYIFCRNSLVFCVSQRHKQLQIDDIKPVLLSNQIKRIGIGDPEYVPAGRYAKEYLKERKLYELIKSKFIFGNNVRQVLSWLQQDEVDGAFVYNTDAKIAGNWPVIEQVDQIASSTLDYPAFITKQGQSNQTAKLFIEFLKTEKAKTVLKSHGFISF